MSPAIVLVLQFLGIGLIFYFLIIRPQAKARARAAEMLAALKRGDEITTVGGIVGRVKQLKEQHVVIESGTAELVIERARIIRVGDVSTPGS